MSSHYVSHLVNYDEVEFDLLETNDDDLEFISSDITSLSSSSNHIFDQEEAEDDEAGMAGLKIKRVDSSKKANAKSKSAIRKKRIRKRLPPKSVAHLPEIRILKTDIRRRTAEMVMKVLNNYDINTMDSFLHNFCSPGFRFTEIIPKLANVTTPNSIEGLENIIKSWAYCFSIMPDCVFHLYDAKFIRTLGYGGSRVVCKASLTGTKLYHVVNPLINNEKNHEYSVMQQICAVGNNLQQFHICNNHKSKSNSSLNSLFANTKFYGEEDIQYQPQSPEECNHNINEMNKIIELCYTKNPVKVYVEGVFVFHLDGNNRCTELKNDCEYYQEMQ